VYGFFQSMQWSFRRVYQMKAERTYEGKKFIVIGTHGADHPEKATMVFACANAAVSIGIETSVFLTSDAVSLARKDAAGKLPKVPGMASTKELIESFVAGGGKIQVCVPCCESRGITKKDFIDGVRLINLVEFAAQTVDADRVLTC
jgi:uncharacterized protein involved in oxidation of intracellular sulfur